MRTKVLGVNQRIQLAQGYPSLLAKEISLFARALSTVGLTLEIEDARRDGEVRLFAARRPATSDVAISKDTP